MLDIVRIPAFSDNYIWLVHDPASGETMVVDPALAEPVLAEAARVLVPGGHLVVTVDKEWAHSSTYENVSDEALKFVRRYKLTYPSLRDRDGQFADRYGSRAFPETFVIDRRGRIAALRRGPVDQAWLDRTLPPLLGEKA